MAFSSAATIIYAYTFNLVDPNGIITGQLTQGSDPTSFPNSASYNGLEMLHNDVATTDSSLRWTHPGTAGVEYVQLAGPQTVGAGGNRLRLNLAMIPGSFTRIFMDAARPDGAVDAQAARITLTGANNATQRSISLTEGGSSIQLTDNPPTVQLQAANAANAHVILQAGGGAVVDVRQDGTLSIDATSIPLTTGGASRGSIYGVSFHQASIAAATTNITIAQVVLATINLPDAPVTGAMAVVSFSALVHLLIDGDDLVVYCDVDGTVQNPVTAIQTGLAVTTAAFNTQTSGTVQVSVGVGTHTVRLLAHTTTTNNSWSIVGNGGLGGNTILNVVYYR